MVARLNHSLDSVAVDIQCRRISWIPHFPKAARDQTLTDHLYGGNARYRLCLETVLGMGGIATLRAS
jgi:hypothetical protein